MADHIACVRCDYAEAGDEDYAAVEGDIVSVAIALSFPGEGLSRYDTDSSQDRWQREDPKRYCLGDHDHACLPRAISGQGLGGELTWSESLPPRHGSVFDL